METPPPLRIAIIGGGLGGLALAIALSKHKHLETTIYEARSSFGEIGAGIGLTANAQDALRRIDPRITDAFFDGVAAFDEAFFEYFVGAKGPLEGQRVVKVLVKDKRFLGTAHRAHVLDILVKALPENVRVEFGKRLVDVSGCGPAELGFADGSEVMADLVAGCDGIRSICRRLVFHNSERAIEKAEFAGVVAYRGLISMPAAEEVLGMEISHGRPVYLGHGGHIIAFPVAHGTLMNVVAFHKRESWDSEQIVLPAQGEHMRRDFDASRWTDKAVKIIQLVRDPNAWAIFHHPHTPTFRSADDSIVLVGDAAHSMTPHYGQGAGMAFEDALVLAGLLGDCHVPTDLHRALHAYDFVRVPRSNKVVEKSFDRCQRMCLAHMGGDGDGELAEEDMPQLIRDWDYTPDWIWHEDMGAHLDEALREFHRGQ